LQVRKALELREEWGDKPCDHPEFENEYDLGAQTGDYVCTQCGRTFTRTEVEKIRLRRDDKA
jgi:hypothetical protein